MQLEKGYFPHALFGRNNQSCPADKEMEEEVADYNGDEDNEGEFEADKQAELAQDWGNSGTHARTHARARVRAPHYTSLPIGIFNMPGSPLKLKTQKAQEMFMNYPCY